MEPTIYPLFKGNCLEAMAHYAEVLGGEIVGVFRNADAPDAESRMPGGDDMIMNMSVKLGAATVMASDSPEDMFSKPQGFRVSISPSSRGEFDRVHEALAQRRAIGRDGTRRDLLGRTFRHVHRQVLRCLGCWASKAARHRAEARCTMSGTLRHVCGSTMAKQGKAADFYVTRDLSLYRR